MLIVSTRVTLPFFLPACTNGFMGSSLWSVGREREELGADIQIAWQFVQAPP